MASPYLYSAVLPYFYAPHHHFAFLISHSSEAFARNQGNSPIHGLALYKLMLNVMTPSLYDTSRLPFMSLAMSRAIARPMP